MILPWIDVDQCSLFRIYFVKKKIVRECLWITEKLLIVPIKDGEM